MPLTAEQRAAYGPDWPQVSRAIRARAGSRCECSGECGLEHERLGLTPRPRWWPGVDPDRCPALNGRPSPVTGSRVVLTVAHLDHDPGVNDPARLRAMCQRCHLALRPGRSPPVARPPLLSPAAR